MLRFCYQYTTPRLSLILQRDDQDASQRCETEKTSRNGVI